MGKVNGASVSGVSVPSLISLQDVIPKCNGPAHDGPCQRTAGWGTPHVGGGLCRDHDNPPVKDGIPPLPAVRNSYASVVANSRFRELISYYEQQESIDSLDDEIVLMKSLIALLAEFVGLDVKIDENGQADVMQGYLGLSSQSREIVSIIRTLSETIKVKYQIIVATREAIPRDDVRKYIAAIETVLQKSLRDTCPHCGREIGMLTTVLIDLGNIQSL